MPVSTIISNRFYCMSLGVCEVQTLIEIVCRYPRWKDQISSNNVFDI